MENTSVELSDAAEKASAEPARENHHFRRRSHGEVSLRRAECELACPNVWARRLQFDQRWPAPTGLTMTRTVLRMNGRNVYCRAGFYWRASNARRLRVLAPARVRHTLRARAHRPAWDSRARHALPDCGGSIRSERQSGAGPHRQCKRGGGARRACVLVRVGTTSSRRHPRPAVPCLPRARLLRATRPRLLYSVGSRHARDRVVHAWLHWRRRAAYRCDGGYAAADILGAQHSQRAP